MLQINIIKTGGIYFRSPKYHCEIYGEGINYSWGSSKYKYQHIKADTKNVQSQKTCE